MEQIESITKITKQCGLFFDTYSPGDGVSRYRFFREETDYFAGRGIYTALGKKEALTFLAGYFEGKAGK